MWRCTLVAAMLLVASGCSPTGESALGSCGPFRTTWATLSGASAFSSSDIWAVGAYQNAGPSLPLIDHWDGKRWTAIEAPAGRWDKGAALSAVSGAAPDDVWAVGLGGTTGLTGTLIEHWDGNNWSVVASPNPGATYNRLAAVDATSASDAWAVGEFSDSGPQQPLVEHWDGTSWTVTDTPKPADETYELASIAAVDANDVWALGTRLGSNNSPRHALIEHWDGIRWSVQDDAAFGSSANLTDIDVLSSTDVWALGVQGGALGTLIEHWDGLSWTVVPSPKVPNVAMQTIAAVSSGDVWIAGAEGAGWLIEHWDGTRWQQTSAASGSSGAVAAVVVATESAWAVGSHYVRPCGPTWALIERWDGNTWNYVHSPHDAPAS